MLISYCLENLSYVLQLIEVGTVVVLHYLFELHWSLCLGPLLTSHDPWTEHYFPLILVTNIVIFWEQSLKMLLSGLIFQRVEFSFCGIVLQFAFGIVIILGCDSVSSTPPAPSLMTEIILFYTAVCTFGWKRYNPINCDRYQWCSKSLNYAAFPKIESIFS